MSRVVYVHVGAPKTGTTYVQDRLRTNRGQLAEHDVHYPLGPTWQDHFRPALDLMEADWGGPPGHAEGLWDALARRIRRLDGKVIIGHEVMAAASPAHIQRAMADLDGDEVHVVYSARDLARQIPAVWQESIKQRRQWTFEKCVQQIREQRYGGFWKAQGLPDVLGRWSAGLPPERVHLVTVPQDDADPGPLWHRFCAAFGIEPAWAPEESERRNESMGVAETAVVRLLNRRLHGSGLRTEDHAKLVKDFLVHENLAQREGRTRIALPHDLYPWVEELAERAIEWVEGSGIHVVGDVDELRPVPPDPDEKWADPDLPGPKRALDAAIDGLAAMTLEAAGRSDPEAQLARKLGRAARRVRGQ